MDIEKLSQIARFSIFGLLSVSIDYFVMRLALTLSVSPGFSKLLGYMTALFLVSMFVVRFTFRKNFSPTDRIRVAGIYVVTGLFTAFVFDLTLLQVGSVELAFLVTLVFSSSLNFLGLSYLVARRSYTK